MLEDNIQNMKPEISCLEEKLALTMQELDNLNQYTKPDTLEFSGIP